MITVHDILASLPSPLDVTIIGQADTTVATHPVEDQCEPLDVVRKARGTLGINIVLNVLVLGGSEPKEFRKYLRNFFQRPRRIDRIFEGRLQVAPSWPERD